MEKDILKYKHEVHTGTLRMDRLHDIGFVLQTGWKGI